MLNLNGILSNQDIFIVNKLTADRFRNKDKFVTPESLILYEYRYLTREQLLTLCSKAYGDIDLVEPQVTYLPQTVIDMFQDSFYVPVQYSSVDRKIKAIKLVDDLPYKKVDSGMYTVEYVNTTLHYYIECYTKLYGHFYELLRIAGRECLDMIFEESITLGAIDTTIHLSKNEVEVFHNVKKKKVNSARIFTRENVLDFIKILTIKTPIADKTDRRPKYVGYDINSDYRARVIINTTFSGYSITCRLIPTEEFMAELEDLGFSEEMLDFMLNEFCDSENGLRLLVGETASGKNTTCFSAVRRMKSKDDIKVVSVGRPVERIMKGIIQIDTETDEEYKSNVRSLIHQNPDLVYLEEMSEYTGSDILKVANTGKKVISTLHTNSVADTLSRLVDITGLSIDRILQVMHSVVHQKLENIGGELVPVNRFMRFTDDIKYELYGKSLGEIIKYIKDNERR